LEKKMKPGMSLSEAKKRVMRIARNPGNAEYKKNLIHSVINQAGVREGQGAKTELVEMLTKGKAQYKNESLTFSGAGSKQSGIGPGKKLGDGRWQLIDNKWERV
jgi:hypothetical protein